ncbi:lipid droplet-associated protein [Gordonia sp. CPCC 205515]|uniref:lipid droplet-associated protein n=1 Tax=Gordonia sp. CPCC 205515 TaxID=3140791 RepID=UPI003AF33766
MVRAPYPARIAAGLVVTAIEETKKIPALVITFPMTAVSQTLQAGMRMQQSIAELAIKGDAALGALFDKPTEQPEWARFDEDDDTLDAEADRTPIESRPTPVRPPAAKAPAPAKKAPAKKAAPKKSSPAEHSVTKHTDSAAAPDASAGRFALYSTPPEALVGSEGSTDKPAAPVNGSVPEIVEYLEYDNLTLAQLRAKLRTVSLPELEDLAGYEKATKARAPFVTMIDNRIASHTKRPSST